MSTDEQLNSFFESLLAAEMGNFQVTSNSSLASFNKRNSAESKVLAHLGSVINVIKVTVNARVKDLKEINPFTVFRGLS